MQAIMWGILGATIVLAAVVGSAARNASRVDLSPEPITLNEVSVRLPLTWRTRPRGEDPRVIAQAADPSREAQGRSIRVLVDRVDAPISPLQYLVDRFGIGVDSSADDAGGPSEPITLPIAGRTGILILGQRSDSPDAAAEKHLLACAVLPSNRVIVVHLQGVGSVDASDVMVVKQVATSAAVEHEPAVGGNAVVLPGGVQLTAPAGLDVVQEIDPTVLKRCLWPGRAPTKSAEQFEREWTSVELVGCLFPRPAGNDANQRAQAAVKAFSTLLLVRDPGWRRAKIELAGENVWHAEIHRPSGFYEHAYLVADAGGRALLAIFHPGFQSNQAPAIWSEIAPTIRFTGGSDLDALQDIGAAEASRLRRAGLERLLNDRDEQWWLWTDNSERAHFGWSHLNFTQRLAANFETLRRRSDGEVMGLTQTFSYRDLGMQYRSDVKFSPSEATQSATVKGGQISVTSRGADGSVTQSTGAVPPQFVPGAVLPLIMGNLEQRAMLLRTESFRMSDAVGAPELLTIIIRPVQQTKRIAQGEAEPMRCMSAEVNGSGVVSHWYFRRSGALELVEFPHGVQRTASDANTVQMHFGGDRKMSPTPDK
jgi:hypothetical protein